MPDPRNSINPSTTQKQYAVPQVGLSKDRGNYIASFPDVNKTLVNCRATMSVSLQEKSAVLWSLADKAGIPPLSKI